MNLSPALETELTLTMEMQRAPTTENVEPVEQKFSIKTIWKRARNAVGWLLLAYTIEIPLLVTQDIPQPQPITPEEAAQPKSDVPPTFQYVSATPHITPFRIEKNLPHEGENIQTIIDMLDTDRKLQKFMAAYGGSYQPITPWTFANSYSYSPEEAQENGFDIPCSGYAEFACEVGERHGKKMYLAAMWPTKEKIENTKNSESVTEKKSKYSWHIMAFYKRNNSNGARYVVFDNSCMHILDEGQTIEDYVQQCGYELLPIGGIVKWRRTADDHRAKLARHLAFNVPLDDIEESHSDEPWPKKIIAKQDQKEAAVATIAAK